MAQLYITDHRAVVGVKKGRIEVKYGDGLVHSIPSEHLEGISIIGNAQITTRCIGLCLRKGIPIQYYSSRGAYFGKVTSTLHVNTKRQRQQVRLTEDEGFCLLLAQKIIGAKINNQKVVLRRYQRTAETSVAAEIYALDVAENQSTIAGSLPEVLGHEGQAARTYYSALNKLINVAEFRFTGRSRRPPKDAFNSMLSLGYAIIMNDIYGAIEGRGLSPYFGFIHQDREKHPTLASDLIEEWRAVIVDSLVMAMVNGKEIAIDNFSMDKNTKGVFIDRIGLKVFITKVERRLEVGTKYLNYISHAMNFRKAIDSQVLQLCNAIEKQDPDAYQPLRIR